MARQPKPWFWKARRAWFVTIEGKRHNLGPNKKQAQDRFHQLMRQPVGQRVVPQSLAAIIDTYLEWAHKHRSAATYEWYRYRLQRFIGTYPDLRVGDLRPFHVQEWVDASPHLSRTSQRNYLRSVKRCLKWALAQGYVDENPLTHLEVPNGDRREVLITRDEYQNILENCPDPPFRDFVIVTWETGCRPQELLRVEARHVDLQNKRWVFPQKEAKGKKAPRVVYLSDKALAITVTSMAANMDGPLFRNSRGVPWTKDAVNCAVERVQNRIGKAEMQRQGIMISQEEIAELVPTLKPTRVSKGATVPKTDAELRCEAKRKLTQKRVRELVPRYSLYALRHSWATRALQSGLDGLTVAVLMGHSDPSTLARVYQHLSHNPEHLLEQARKAAS